MRRFRKAIAELTDTAYYDWDYIDGPETGVGIEQWFRNKHTGQEAYVCDDQGVLTVSLSEKPTGKVGGLHSQCDE